MLFQRVEITIAVQKRDVVGDAIGADQQINRLANGNPTRAEKAIMCRGRYGNVSTTNQPQLDDGQPAFRLCKIPVGTKPMQHIQED